MSPPVKRNNDQPQINTLNNNDNINKDPKKNMPIVDIPSGNYYFNNFTFYTIILNNYILFCKYSNDFFFSLASILVIWGLPLLS